MVTTREHGETSSPQPRRRRNPPEARLSSGGSRAHARTQICHGDRYRYCPATMCELTGAGRERGATRVHLLSHPARQYHQRIADCSVTWPGSLSDVRLPGWDRA
ncbi:hypothetical protein V5799_024528 [Amblyomma americanum]|uniref:Uncharacterized protein n=1 Tax=Amblyomma americanum TaxID=6943 RepID=A0AAQ4EBR7_AMBAM